MLFVFNWQMVVECPWFFVAAMFCMLFMRYAASRTSSFSYDAQCAALEPVQRQTWFQTAYDCLIELIAAIVCFMPFIYYMLFVFHL